MKKYKPLVIFGVGLLVLLIAFIFVRSRNSKDISVGSDGEVAEIAFEDRPFVSLTPSGDGHWLKLKVDKIKLKKASKVDYLLLYNLPDGRQQGVPGVAEIQNNMMERELLLGSESAGKFTYDEGVEKGLLTIKFRDDKGKLVGKFETDFALLGNTKSLTSVDGNFTFDLSEEAKDVYFVVLETFGVPERYKGEPVMGPYGVFVTSENEFSGNVKFKQGVPMYLEGGDWKSTGDERVSDVGVFLAS